MTLKTKNIGIPNLRKLSLLLLSVSLFQSCSTQDSFMVNTIGINFVLIDNGTFIMGETNNTPQNLEGSDWLTNGDWDEQPVHKVRISKRFYISETEVTIEQFRQFQPDYEGSEQYAPYASGISWYDAVAFCDWLSEKEGKSYRLPTEAEWEYIETYPNGKIKAVWKAGIGDDGRYLLHGTETWFYENGKKKWQADYDIGRKIGRETFWSPDGKKDWTWDCRENGTSVWTNWWPNGRKKTESTWYNFKCEGPATQWDKKGNTLHQVKFENGVSMD